MAGRAQLGPAAQLNIQQLSGEKHSQYLLISNPEPVRNPAAPAAKGQELFADEQARTKFLISLADIRG